MVTSAVEDFNPVSLPRRKGSLILAGILGGFVLFIWSAISWMALPWHTATLGIFGDPNAVLQAVAENVPNSGVYVAPMGESEAVQQQIAAGPMVFASVRLGPMPSMAVLMMRGLLIYIVAALLGALLLSHTKPMSYGSRVAFLVIGAALVGVAGHLPQWNWWGFSLPFTAAEIADLLIGWSLAGLVMAKIIR